MIRRVLYFATAPIVLLTASATILVLDLQYNLGFPVGYYGCFNRFHTALEAVPGVAAVRGNGNHDITLEEMWFLVIMQDGSELGLFFQERDPVRSLRGNELAEALRVRVEEEVAREPRKEYWFMK